MLIYLLICVLYMLQRATQCCSASPKNEIKDFFTDIRKKITDEDKCTNCIHLKDLLKRKNQERELLNKELESHQLSSVEMTNKYKEMKNKYKKRKER